MNGPKTKPPFKIASIALATGLATGLAIASSAAWAGGDELRLETRLTDGLRDIGGKGEFRARDGRRRFSVEVEGFSAGQMFDVEVAGAIVGKVTIDAFGMGDIDFDTNFEAGVDDPATVFPGNFPMLDGGERIEVGPLSGTLQPK